MEVRDSAYTLRLADEQRRDGKFKKGDKPWNKGLSWEQMGVSDEERKRRLSILQATNHKNGYSHIPTRSRPVIQYDDDGNRLHWYISSEAAARKVGCMGRNIRKVCDGQRKHAGGFCWKWDSRF